MERTTVTGATAGTAHEVLTNWAGNYTYRAARLHHPATVDEIRALVAGAARVKVLGSRHSFNAVADTTGDLLSLEHMDRVLDIDGERQTVTVEGGIRYGTLARALSDAGYALHNLASLPHISVAGACATGTHGSGDGNANLATAVAAIEFVTATGDLVTLARERDGDTFRGAVVALGGLGVVTRLTLDVHPAYDIVQHVYEDVPLADLEGGLDDVLGSAYSVSVFTRWTGPRVDQIWLKRRPTPEWSGYGDWSLPTALRGATPASDHRHPILGISPVHCTAQLGVAGPWHDRLPHFRLDYTPSSGAELQTDYLVPREHARAALRAVDALRERIAPLLLVSELRTVAADDLWMSPCYRRDCLSIHFTWKPDGAAVRALLPTIEAALAPFRARPHWGKLFTVAPARIAGFYERLPDFRDLLAAYDPAGKFRNAFLDRYIGRAA
ncbi:MAG TPA: FAD-binding protein [Gemmatirosa sp.]